MLHSQSCPCGKATSDSQVLVLSVLWGKERGGVCQDAGERSCARVLRRKGSACLGNTREEDRGEWAFLAAFKFDL